MAAKTTTTEERIARVGPGRQVIIPREILGTIKIRKGDFVAITKQQNGVLIKKRKHLVDSDDTPNGRRSENRPAWRGAAKTRRVETLACRETCAFALSFPLKLKSSLLGSRATSGNGLSALSTNSK